jgi:thiamine biosynthesis lipoprotein
MIGTTTRPAARFDHRSMGSTVRLTIHPARFGGPPAAALCRCAWHGVVDEFAASDEAMSRFRDDSEITRLNRLAGADRPLRVSRRLRLALVVADRARRATDGRFDPCVLADLDRLGYRGAPIGAARTRGPAERALWVDETGVRLEQPVDLGGIGKGLALRWAAERVRVVHPSASFLLEAGGDIVTHGHAPDGGPWTIGIEDPAGGHEPLAVIGVRSAAVATSSVRVNRWRAGERIVHHLIDPSTGEAADAGLLAVTVADRDPAWAEVWSKALFVAGRSAIADVARMRGLAAWWVADDGRLEMTAAARQRTVWVGGEH